MKILKNLLIFALGIICGVFMLLKFIWKYDVDILISIKKIFLDAIHVLLLGYHSKYYQYRFTKYWSGYSGYRPHSTPYRYGAYKTWKEDNSDDELEEEEEDEFEE